MKKIFILTFILLSFFSVSASRSENLLKIGLVALMTGAGAPWGLAWKKGCQLIAEQINAAGGVSVQAKGIKLKLLLRMTSIIPAKP